MPQFTLITETVAKAKKPRPFVATPGSRPVLVLSLGAGVQSSTLALMAAAGELGEMPECAIFADTGDEPESVYVWLKWLETQLPFPVHHVSAGVLSDDATRPRTSVGGSIYLKPGLPVFFKEGRGMGSRQCTLDYKIEPIRRKLRELHQGRGVVQMIGISMDEVIRMKPSRDGWCKNVWPLIDQGMTRRDCLAWMDARGYPKPPRSACVYCPYHNNAEWRRLRDDEPEEFERAVKFEQRLQAAAAVATAIDSIPFLHRSCVPLSEAPLAADDGHASLFGNECDGMCGV